MTIRLDRDAAILLVGALLAGLGTILPWITGTAGILTVSRSGLEMAADAPVILALAVTAGALVGFQTRWAYSLPLLFAGLAILLALGDFSQLRTRVQETDVTIIAIGAGMYVTIAGAALMVAGSLSRFWHRPT